jgi:tight adherence protein C
MDTMYMVLGLGGLSVVMLILGLRSGKSSAPEFEGRLNAFANRESGIIDPDAKLGFFGRVLKPAIRRWSRTLGERSPGSALEGVRIKLNQAGNPSGLGPVEFLGLRYIIALGLGLGLLGLMMVAHAQSTLTLAICAVVGVLGYMMPNIWLDRKIKARRKEIRLSLPDAIDLLTISVESGLGFDPALQRVAEKWDNALTREFARVLSEMRIGKTKRDALREMAGRVDEDGLTTFVSSVIQADTLGVPITQVLRIQSEAMRVRRRQRAEEQAQKAPLKMLFPMVFLIFPAFYVVILGPALPGFVEAFG